MSGTKRPRIETIAATAGHYLDLQSGGVTPPISMSTTFGRDDRYEPLNAAHIYARDDSPAFIPAERVLAEMENGRECRLFSAGMAAVAAVFSTLETGAHVLMPSSLYWGVTLWTRNYCDRSGIKISHYDASNVQTIRGMANDYGDVDMIWIETPSNPMMDITDIRGASMIAREYNAMLVVDSTVPTPVFTRPLELGADLVVHSATKFLNGHSDVLAGAIVTREEHSMWQKICTARHQAGALPGAFESWLLLRGMRTLSIRVRQAADNAMNIAQFLDGHPRVERVLYPGLPAHPGHELALRQMDGGFGGLLSFLVEGGKVEALKVAGGLRHIINATSLGGVETLIEHRHSVEPPETLIPENLLRLAVGIEHADDLISDLDSALNSAY